MISRGSFARSLAGAAAGLGIVPGRCLAAVGSEIDAHVEVLLDERLGTIAPTIYGHFVENLGGVVYDGVWVGKESSVPNVGGIRKALIDDLRRIAAPVIRFPGGCFADSYDWRDGVGPTNARPRRTNFWADNEPAGAPSDQKYDPNRFGTSEFMRLCRLVGCEPYLAANLRSLPPLVFDQWVEYCNAPAHSTTLADARARDGSEQPFGVRYWAVGNEAWGCGGSFTAQEYAAEFCRYSAFVPGYGRDLSFVASGPDKGDVAWTRGFFEEIARRGKGQFNSIFGFSLHDYTWNLSRGRTSDWVKGKGDALAFDVIDWYELLREGARIEDLIAQHWTAMGEIDADHAVKLVVDEWGSWYRPGSEVSPNFLFEQTPTMRDALYSAMTLDVFNRNADKVAMANCAQLINCLNSLYLAHEDNFCITPVGHVFKMYAAHQGGISLRTILTSPEVRYDRDGKEATLAGLTGSASLHDKTLVLSLVNSSVTAQRTAEISVRGASVVSAQAATLGGADIHAHNTFEKPDVVIPSAAHVEFRTGTATVVLPPGSVSVAVIGLV